MSIISLVDVSFAHEGGQVIFDQLNLTLDTNWKLGLIGRNGRGKTTLLKILDGRLSCRGTVTVSAPTIYYPFERLQPELNAYDQIQLLRPGQPAWRLEREAGLLGLSADCLTKPLNELSGGQAAKILLAALFLDEAAFPLVDEPAAGLDAAGRRAVAAYLRAKRGFMVVSHDRDLLDQSIDHVLSLNRGGVELQGGNFSSWLANRRRQDLFEEAQNAKLEKEAARLAEAARRSAGWAERTEKGKFGAGPVDRGFIGHKAAKMSKRAGAVEDRRRKAQAAAAALVRNVERPARLAMRPSRHFQKRLAEGRDLSLGYGAEVVLRGLSFVVDSGARLALTGPNGAGKSLVLKLLLGQARIHGGELLTASGLKISYVPQRPDFDGGTLKALARGRGLDEGRFKAVLHHLGFEKSQFDTPWPGLSVGQKKKALLAASLTEEAHLHVWDEPLDCVDVFSRLQIEEMILRDGPSLILAEHDEAFVGRVADLTLDLSAFAARPTS